MKQRILTKDLYLHAYKIQLSQELKRICHFKQRDFFTCVMQQQLVNDNLSKKFNFNYEAHF